MTPCYRSLDRLLNDASEPCCQWQSMVSYLVGGYHTLLEHSNLEPVLVEEQKRLLNQAMSSRFAEEAYLTGRYVFSKLDFVELAKCLDKEIGDMIGDLEQKPYCFNETSFPIKVLEQIKSQIRDFIKTAQNYIQQNENRTGDR